MDQIAEILSKPSGRRVLVVGLARSGVAAAKLLVRLGCSVTGTDRRDNVAAIQELRAADVRVEVGGDRLDVLEHVDLVVLSPGVALQNPLPSEASRRALPLLSEIELAARLNRAPILAVTGTNGKSTTAALCAHLLTMAQRRVFLGGNYGTPLCQLLLDRQPVDWAVVEISSYQLEQLTAPEHFAPRIGIWLNLTPDHLDRHGNLERYAKAKRRLFEGQGPGDTGIFFLDDEVVRQNAQGLRCRMLGFSREPQRAYACARIDGRNIHLVDSGTVLRLSGDRLMGGHNAENAAAAIVAAMTAGVRDDVIQRGLDSFPGLAHRLQPVAEIHGVRYINDSKGTNIDATAKSLQSFEGPIVLIAGGRGKGAPYTPLRDVIARRVKHLILLGEDAERMAHDLDGSTTLHRVKDLSEAVFRAATLAQPGDVVLLSPACASFDQFRDFEERGEVFMQLVHQLEGRR
jgi:UDP-N-acetylmuramoylalanine--D-glutamate ligase